jgi:acetyl esterase
MNKLLKNGFAIISTSCMLFLYGCSGQHQQDKKLDSTKTETGTTENKSAPNSTVSIKPHGPKPAWGKDMKDQMAAVIEKLVSYNDQPLTSLSAKEARKQHSPADAAMDVMKEHNIIPPASGVDTVNKRIAVKNGEITIRIYTPKTGKDNYPVLVYFHGGGWVIADLNTYNASAETLSKLVNAVVVSVAYRQAPEHKFPTAHNDCFAAYEWVLKNAPLIKGDPGRIAVVGESAGGNLAASVCMMARDKKIKMPLHEVLVYPIAGYNFNTPSYEESDSIKPLNADLMKWFFEKYLKKPSDGKSPWISLVTADLSGLPPTTIVAAEYDPLRSEGKLLSENLSKAGVNTKYKLYEGTTHEFFGMAALVPEAKEAQTMVAEELKKALK